MLFCLVALTLAGLSTWANLDLTDARAALFMDEMIPFDNVKRILTAPSTEALGFAIADGGDHRYGRIFYNVSALVGWLPYRVAGDTGLIIAIRGTQSAMLIGAMVVISLSLLRTWGARALGLLAMACLPYTDYYLSQPKPEPGQLLCYALFLLFALRQKFAFGWHWLFLGLAFGAKISAAPFCAVAALLGLTHAWLFSAGWKRTFTGCATTALTFLTGWLIAIPMLAVPTRERLDAYIGWTFKATGHGFDDTRITALDWMKSLLAGGEVVRGAYPPWVAIGLLATSCLVLVLAFLGVRRRRIALREFLESQTGWMILVLAAALLIPIMLAVKRLWGFYLFPGQVFAIAALASIAEQWLAMPESSRWLVRVRRATLAMLTGLTLTACFYSGRLALQEYGRLAHRTSDPFYLRNMAVYESAIGILEPLAKVIAQGDGRPLDVVYDPFLFLPESDTNLNIQVFWAKDVGWKNKPSVLVLGRTWHLAYFLGEKPLPPETVADFRPLATAVEQFNSHVDPNPNVATNKPYQLVRWLGEDAAIIMRKDIAEKWRAMAENSSASNTKP